MTGALTAAVEVAPLVGPRTGVGVVVDGWVRALAGRSDVAVRAFALSGRGAGELPGLLPPGVAARTRPAPARPLLGLWARTDHPVAEWWTGRVDVIHGTNFVVPPSRRAARVVTVHDLTCVLHPEMCTPTARRYPALVRRAVRTGAWVHTLSRTVADEVVEHLGARPDRVRVVPAGVDPPGPEPGTAPDTPPGLPAGVPYLLALGTSEPRKDLHGLVAAFDRLADGHPDLHLCLAGQPGWAEDDLRRAISAATHGDRVHRLGWVRDRTALLRGAVIFVYPSLYEGFGLPPLEAMAAGVPVVATACGAVPEVVGDAARLVPCRNPEALAEVLDAVLTDDDERCRLIVAGRTRVAGYRWDTAGEGLVDVYREAAGV